MISRRWAASQYQKQAALCGTRVNIPGRINIVESQETDYQREMMKMMTGNSQLRVEKMTEVMTSIIAKVAEGREAFDLGVPVYVYKALQKQFPDQVELLKLVDTAEHLKNDEEEVIAVFFKDRKAYEKHEAER